MKKWFEKMNKELILKEYQMKLIGIGLASLAEYGMLIKKADCHNETIKKEESIIDAFLFTNKHLEIFEELLNSGKDII